MTIVRATILKRFDWTAENGQCHITFAVTEMLSAIADGKLPYDAVTSPIDWEFVQTWIVKRDIFVSKVRAIMRDKVALDKPVLGAYTPNNTVLLIDGSHRYMARYMLDRSTIDYHIVRQDFWTIFATIQGDLNNA